MDQKNLSKHLFLFFQIYNIKLFAFGDKGSGETEWKNDLSSIENELLYSLPANVFDGIQFEKWLNKFTAGILCYKKLEKSETNAKHDETETIKFGQKMLDEFCQNFKNGHGIVQAVKMAEKQSIELMKKMEADRKMQKLIENAKNDPKIKEIIEKSKNSSNFKKLTKDQLEKIVSLKFGEMATQMKSHGLPYHSHRSKRAADSSAVDRLMLNFDLVTTCTLLFAYFIINFFVMAFCRQNILFFFIIIHWFLFETFITNCLLFRAQPWQRFQKSGMDDDSHKFWWGFRF